jgi:hypothetical protein
MELPAVRSLRGMDSAARPLALRSLPLRDVGHGRNHFSGQSSSLTIWFRAIWQVTSQKYGISALGLQRVLGLGSYKTDWAMVRPGRVRLQTIPNLTRTALHGYIAASVESGSTVRTDGFKSYLALDGYVHQRHLQTEQLEEEHVLPRVHRVIGLLKRWLMGSTRAQCQPTIWTIISMSSPSASTVETRRHAANCSIDWRNKLIRFSQFRSRNW